MCARNKGGKGLSPSRTGETLRQPSVIGGTHGSVELPDATHVACLTASRQWRRPMPCPNSSS